MQLLLDVAPLAFPSRSPRCLPPRVPLRHYLKDGLVIDVFIDYLNFCHRIDLRESIHPDYPTISLDDLLLSKLQIVEIAEKDVQDANVLLLEHEVSDGAIQEKIDTTYIDHVISFISTPISGTHFFERTMALLLQKGKEDPWALALGELVPDEEIKSSAALDELHIFKLFERNHIWTRFRFGQPFYPLRYFPSGSD
jgi:hypothetical protein